MATVRLIQKSDISDLKEVLDSIELFPSEMLEDMIADYFENPESEDIWFAATNDEKVIGFGFCAPEKLTNGTYNLYAIGVRSDLQGQGVGAQMMHFIEDILKNKGKRILIVDTSGTAEFELTRKFYAKLGYDAVATIPDFWDDGDDKVTFRKSLR